MKATFTDAFAKNVTVPGRYTDPATKGLNLNVKNGRKYWVLRYTLAGLRRDLTLGSYPAISLKEARNRAVACRAELIAGREPNGYWKAPVRTGAQISETLTFREFAQECIKAKSHEWRNQKHGEQWHNTLAKYADPVIGSLPLDAIDTEHILKILTPIWHTKTETASRLRGRIEWVLASATTRKLRSGQNPAAWRGHLETVLPRPSRVTPVDHHPALPYKQIPALMKQLADIDGVSALALQFLILNASRSGEVLGGLRCEIDELGMWTIPGSRMKAGKAHRVPLGRRALEILQVAKMLDPGSRFLFSKKGNALSNMAMLMLVRRMGLGVTVHGFRSAFRDWVAEETAHNPDAAELALAHTIPNKVESAYRRGDMLEQRRRLMNDWEAYCFGKIAKDETSINLPKAA
jgi:integrase